MERAPYDDILHKGFEEYRRYVNPLIANRAALTGEPVALTHAVGGALARPDGALLEDFHGTQALGHRNPEIAAALREYLATDVTCWYPSRVNPFAGRLARRLYERTGYDNAFFGCHGTDGVEAAIKLARAHSRRPRVLGLAGGYHGCTMGSLSLMDRGYLRDAFEPLLPGVESLPFGDVPALERALAAGDVAAVVVEPVQGEGGVRALPEPYVAALCELTARHGALLVSDEVQTGLGRTGRGFLATESWPRRPDAVVLAKHLGGGLMPLGAMLTRREIFLRAYGTDFASGESHNVTNSNNAMGCVAGLAALDLVTDELVARVRERGTRLKAEITAALAGSPLFREVRGEGFMLGVVLRAPDHPWLSFEHFGFPARADQSVIGPLVCHRLYPRGFYCYPCGHDWSIVRVQPRYDIPDERLAAFVRALREELAYVEALG